MDIPYIVLLIPLAAAALFGGVFLFFNIFHLWRYGIEGWGTISLIMLYVALYAVILLGTLLLLGNISWDGSFSLNELLPTSSRSSSFGL